MTGEPDARAMPRWVMAWRPWHVLRVVLIGAWVLWAVLAWWSAPRPAEFEQAHADVTADEVAVYQWADSWERRSGISTWSSPPALRSSGREGPLFVWRTHDGRTYYVTLDGDTTAPTWDGSAGEGAEPLGPQTESIRAAVMASVLDTGRPLHGNVGPVLRFLPAIIGLVCLAILIGGPAPLVGTRWYWFWISTGIPFGLGVLAWLVLERPWSSRVVPPPGSGVDKRHRGLAGFLITIATSVVLSGLGVLAGAIFDVWVIPERPV